MYHFVVSRIVLSVFEHLGEDVNRGVHVIRVRWGRLTALHAYLDTRLLVDALDRLGRAGYAESQAAPIVG